MAHANTGLARFQEAFFQCALWSSNDAECDASFEAQGFTEAEIAPSTYAALATECAVFYNAHCAIIGDRHMVAGHDFWLSRTGHGAGFADGHWKEHGEALAFAARRFDHVDLYVGDDGLIYAFGYEPPMTTDDEPRAKTSKGATKREYRSRVRRLRSKALSARLQVAS